jgi:hypothetical protein
MKIPVFYQVHMDSKDYEIKDVWRSGTFFRL